MTDEHATYFSKTFAKRPSPMAAQGASASRFSVSPNLHITLHDDGDPETLSNAADDLLTDHDKTQRAWKKLQKRAEAESTAVLISDDSSARKVLLYGRYLPPKLMKPVYWAVNNNKVDFSASFAELHELDKVNLANQVLKEYAKRSEKNDLKCAALAVSEKGQFYVAMNTQETDTMEYDKECAEANLSTVVKQLKDSGDKIKRMYVLGGLLDVDGKLRSDSPLISMCMRCVEKTWAIFASDALVTAIPMQENPKFIGLDFSKTKSGVGKDVAWQVPYMTLKGPSIITFSDAVQKMQHVTFEKMLRNKVNFEAMRYAIVSGLLDYHNKRPTRVRTDERSVLRLFSKQMMDIATINDYMVSQAAESIHKCEGMLDNIEIAMIEVCNSNGGKRYICETEVRGKNHNATTAPVTTATFHAKLSKKHGEHISHIYMMGYDPQGNSYNASCEQWDRAVKRAGGKSENVPVDFLPFNAGWRTSGMDIATTIQTKSLAELSGGGFAGSKQMNGNGHVHGPECAVHADGYHR